MKDAQFEQQSRAHLFWSEWQGTALLTGDPDTYLDGLIAKASPQWAGIDVDAFMDEVRGREENLNEHLARHYPDWAFVLADEGKREPETGKQLFFDL